MNYKTPIKSGYLSLFIFFILIINFKISKGQNLETKESPKRVAWGFGVGPQVSITDWDRYDVMIGPDILMNWVVDRKILLTADLHGAMTTNWEASTLKDHAVTYLGSGSVLLGARIYETEKSAFQLEGGFSVGYLYYAGEIIYDSDTSNALGTTYDYDNLNFGGITCKTSYRHLTKKMVGYEVYISTNLHVHPELAFGINFRFGKMR